MVSFKTLVILFIFVGSLIWSAALSRPDGRYHIWNTSSKSQLSLLIKSPRGKFAVINPESAKLAAYLNDKLPFYERGISLTVIVNQTGVPTMKLKYFQTDQTWDLQHSVSKDNLSDQMEWEGLRLQSWSVPGTASFLLIRSPNHSLAYVSLKSESFWNAIPFDKQTEVVVDAPSEDEIVW